MRSIEQSPTQRPKKIQLLLTCRRRSKMILKMANEGTDYPWEEQFGEFKELLDMSTSSATIFGHPNRKSFLRPLTKRAELVMADFEEWTVTDENSILLDAVL